MYLYTITYRYIDEQILLIKVICNLLKVPEKMKL